MVLLTKIDIEFINNKAYHFAFNERMNLIHGVNGIGKTTLLKKILEKYQKTNFKLSFIKNSTIFFSETNLGSVYYMADFLNLSHKDLEKEIYYARFDSTQRQLLDSFRELINETFPIRQMNELFIFTDRQNNPIPFANLSDGELRYLEIMLYPFLIAEENSIILMDLPENYLHIGFQLNLIDQLLKIGNVRHLQFILATHSPQIANSHVPQFAISMNC